MGKIIGHAFVVVGSGNFPFDMLRYDACHPRTSDDVQKMTRGFRETGTPQEWREVELVSNVKQPTEARWSSFGWTVRSVTEIR